MDIERHRPIGRHAGICAFVLTVGVSALMGLTGCSSTEPTAHPSPAQAVQTRRTITREQALGDFDRVWEIVNETHFDPTFNGVDWEAVREELRPKAATAKNQHEVRAVISEALARLGQSHFGIIPGPEREPNPTSADQSEPDQQALHTDDSDDGVDDGTDSGSTEIPTTRVDDSAMDGSGNGDTGIDLRIIDGQAVVSSIRDGSPAQLEGIKTGWILNKIRSMDVAETIGELGESLSEEEIQIHAVQLLVHQLVGPVGTTTNLTFLDGDNHKIERTITRAPMAGETVKFGGLPALSTHLEWSEMTTTPPSGKPMSIGIIAFNIWMMPIAPKFERAMYELHDVDGLIIDLRGNPGGIGGLSSSIGRFLMDKKASLGTMTMRGAELSFNIEPVIVTTWGEPLDPYTGPIAILTDSGTASTSEVFAGGLQSLGRVRVFGSRSAGMALPAAMDKLPSGDTLLHAIANFVTSTGYQLEQGGVVPDQAVPLTRQDLLDGIDAPKQAAIHWIEQGAAQ